MADDAANFLRIPMEVFNEGRLELIETLVAEDFVEHVERPPGIPAGREGLRFFAAARHDAFPDLRYELLRQFQDGDTHIGHFRVSGTMAGDFLGMPASGKSATWEEMHIGRVVDGQLREHWAVLDRLGMLQQLGFVPAPPGS
jgi:predicted ester cyclase